MATHSSIFAWKIPRAGEPGGLQSMGSQGVRHSCATEHACTRRLRMRQAWNLGPFAAVLAPEHTSPKVAEYWDITWY